MNSTVSQQYVDQFSAQFHETMNVVFVEDSRTHMATSLVLPPNVVVV